MKETPPTPEKVTAEESLKRKTGTSISFWHSEPVVKLDDALKAIELARQEEQEKVRELLIAYTDSLRDYIGESHSDISNDERESKEFVDIFLSDIFPSLSGKEKGE